MGCLMWPIRLVLTLVKIADRLNEVDEETERIRKVYGMESARRYKRQMYLGLSIRAALCIIGLVITVLLITLIFTSE